MFISPAYAQSAGTSPGGGLEALLPLVLIFVVFYFLLIRPQQKKMKQHKATLAAIRRGDTVVTGGGIIGKVSRVTDDGPEVQVEIAPDVKVKVQRELISAVISKSEAIAAKKEAKEAEKVAETANEDGGVGEKQTSILGKMFGRK